MIFLLAFSNKRFVIIKDPNATGILVKLRKKRDAFPDSECILISDCINKIKPGSRYTFADVNYENDINNISKEIRKIYFLGDFSATGGHQGTLWYNTKMWYPIGKRTFLDCLCISCPTEKQSLHWYYQPRVREYWINLFFLFLKIDAIEINYSNKTFDFCCFRCRTRIMEFQQSGFFYLWEDWFNPMPPKCLANTKGRNQKHQTKPSAISLKNLTGAFEVLLTGFSLSILAFLFELNNLHTLKSKLADAVSKKKVRRR